MVWFGAMLALLAVMLLQRDMPVHKLRTWAAMTSSSIAAWGVVYATSIDPVTGFIVIDTVAGMLVLARPAGVAQKAIGFLYAIMVMYHIGLVMASLYGQTDTEMYTSFMVAAGWGQFAILALWSVWDVGKSVVNWDGLGWHRSADKQNNGGHK